VHLDRRLVGWGLFFVVLGSVPLAVRAGLVSTDIVGRWPLLWPLLLIGWGLGLILRRTPGEWLGGLITAITLGLMGGGLLAAGFAGVPTFTTCGSGGASTAFAPRNGTFHDGARLSVEFDCGQLGVASVDGSAWSVSGTDASGHGPDLEGSADSITLRSGSDTGAFFGPGGHLDWRVSVPRQPSLGLGLTLNAGQGTVDLGGAHLAAFDLTVNAGKLDADLGKAASVGSVNVTVNAGSATLALPAFAGDADASLNAGSLRVCLPPSAAVRVHWSGALAGNDLDRSGLSRVDDSTWTSPGFDPARPHLELRVSANAGSFNLELGGSCGA
jgi:hypothetical protein